jgi:hypothetical protein
LVEHVLIWGLVVVVGIVNSQEIVSEAGDHEELLEQ